MLLLAGKHSDWPEADGKGCHFSEPGEVLLSLSLYLPTVKGISARSDRNKSVSAVEFPCFYHLCIGSDLFVFKVRLSLGGAANYYF